MTTIDQSATTICELINSCREAHEAFRSAAEAAGSSVLKQLFGLYAQQRSRFAEELRGFASAELGTESQRSGDAEGWGRGGTHHYTVEAELLESCLRREKSAMALYRKALAERTLPTKAHFLVSAQLALLERVHYRIETLRPDARTAILRTGERAMV